MGIRKSKFQAGDRVYFEDREVTVLSASTNHITIRNVYGYQQKVKPSQLRAMDVPAKSVNGF